MASRGHDLLHEAEAQGLGGTEFVAGEQVALCVAPAGALDETHRRAAGRNHAALDLDLREAAVVSRDDDVLREHQFDAERETDALHRAHHRLRAHRLAQAERIDAVGRNHRLPAPHHFCEEIELKAGGEIGAVREHHADPGVGVALERAECVGQRPVHRGGEAVQLLRSVDADEREGVAPLECDAAFGGRVGCAGHHRGPRASRDCRRPGASGQNRRRVGADLIWLRFAGCGIYVKIPSSSGRVTVG